MTAAFRAIAVYASVAVCGAALACAGHATPDIAIEAPATLKGKVNSASNAHLDIVKITLLNVMSGRTWTDFADKEHRFKFKHVPSGRYQLSAVSSGFMPFVGPEVTLRPKEERTLDIFLRTQQPSTTDPSSGQLGRQQPSEVHQMATTKVFFATDRDKFGEGLFGSQRGRGLSYGACVVTIPRDHRLARIERPEWWQFMQTMNATRFFVISLRVDLSRDAFFPELRNAVMTHSSRQALIFIHGFNVAFDDAVYRTAQIAYDLGFDGVPILYSWPAYQGNMLTDYVAALNNNEWTEAHLETVIRELVRESGATTVHIIAHSMGNRALLHALADLSKDRTLQLSSTINQLVLTAPDVDADVFRQLADRVRATSKHVTLYASSRDEALLLSKELQGDYTRAGDATAPLVIPGIDTIDASAVDTNFIGHSYYGDNRSVLSDLFTLLTGAPPEKRFGIVRMPSRTGSYWAFRP